MLYEGGARTAVGVEIGVGEVVGVGVYVRVIVTSSVDGGEIGVGIISVSTEEGVTRGSS